MIETKSSEEKGVQKETGLPLLHSIKSVEDIVKGNPCNRTCSNELLFEEWYLNKVPDLSFFLDDCLNWHLKPIYESMNAPIR